MSVFVTRVAGKGTNFYHLTADCEAFYDESVVREVSKAKAIETYSASLCGRCSQNQVYVKRGDVQTYHRSSECRYVDAANSVRVVERDTAIGFFDADPCRECAVQEQDHSTYQLLKERGEQEA